MAFINMDAAIKIMLCYFNITGILSFKYENCQLKLSKRWFMWDFLTITLISVRSALKFVSLKMAAASMLNMFSGIFYLFHVIGTSGEAFAVERKKILNLLMNSKHHNDFVSRCQDK